MGLKGFTSINDSLPINDIRQNLISFFDYGLLEKGGIINAGSGVYGIQETTLRPVSDPRYNNGQVWNGLHSNWAWESGIGALVAASGGVSGVYVNSGFYAVDTTGTYAHVIDHPNGVVIFNEAIPTTSTVTCNYSYKYIKVTSADGLPWFQQIQQMVDQSSDFVNQSGEYSLLPQNRHQLPTIGFEVSPRRTMQGYQLGGGQTIVTTFFAHCIAEDPYVRDFLTDVVSMQRELSFYMYDLNEIYDSGTFPLTVSGSPVSGALTYPNLVNQHKGRILRIADTNIDSIYSLSNRLHVGTVKLTTEIIHFGV